MGLFSTHGGVKYGQNKPLGYELIYAGLYETNPDFYILECTFLTDQHSLCHLERILPFTALKSSGNHMTIT